MAEKKKTIDEALAHLNADQKANLADLIQAREEGGREALRAAIKRLNPHLPDPRDKPAK